MAFFTALKKISRMSSAELVFRVRDKMYHTIEKLTHQSKMSNIYRDDYNFFESDCQDLFRLYLKGDIKDLVNNSRFMRKISRPLTEEQKRFFINNYPDEYKMTLKRADNFLENKFDFLGVKFQFKSSIPWQCDPISLNSFPTGFYRDIDIFSNENVGDVKHVWEVNRLQFIIEIAKAYFLSNKEKYRLKIEDLILDWYEKNPFKTGIAWASALEVGVRIFSLVWILNFYMAGKKQNCKVVRVLIKLIYLSAIYLEKNLSIYFSPYNHLIGEAAGLFIAAYLFPSFKNAKRFEKVAWQILYMNVEEQFHNDGGSVEQANFYHHFTLGFYLQVIAFKRLNSESIPKEMMSKIEEAIEYAMYITKPDKTLPYLGDIDDARSIYFTNPTNWNFLAYQTIGASWFKNSNMKFVSEKLNEDAFWLFTQNDIDVYNELNSISSNRKCIHLNDTGYSIFRTGYMKDSHYSQIDYGPIAAGVSHDETKSAAHGHADLLSIEISAFGDSYLIDPGFSNYRGDFAWHSYFRSTAAHNTIEIDETSQAKQGGILQWSCAPKFKVLQTIQNDIINGVCAEHYGYERLQAQPVHRRTFLFIDELFWVTFDEIFSKEKADRKFKIKYHLHFSNEVSVDVFEKFSTLNCKGKTSELNIDFVSNSDALFFQKLLGGDTPEKGWICPTYLNRIPAPVVCVDSNCSLPFNLLTLYTPNQNDDTNKLLINKNNGKYILIENDRVQYKIYHKDNMRSVVQGIKPEKAIIIQKLNIEMNTQELIKINKFSVSSNSIIVSIQGR